MRLGNTSPTERDGVHLTGLVVSRLKWIFREQTESDYGIDAHIELVSSDELVSGRLIGVQIKSGDSHLHEVKRSVEEPGWSYWADSDHLAYWLGHCLPVIVVFVDLELNAYWQTVTPDSIRETPKGFTIWVPEEQRLDAANKPLLQEFASRWRSLDAKLPELCELLPPSVKTILLASSEEDATATTRLASLMVNGSERPAFTIESVLASQPTWLAGSPVAEGLWLAAARFAGEHGHDLPASECFQRLPI